MTLSAKDYRDHMSTILDHVGGSFYLIRAEHARYLEGNGTAVLVLAYLLNLLRMKNAHTEDRKKLRQDEMWFRCPAKQIQKALGMWDKKQQTAIRDLKSKALIETQHRAGNTLWLRVNTDTLKKILEKELEENPIDEYDEEPSNTCQEEASTRKVEATFQKSNNDFTGKVEATFPYNTNKPTNKPTVHTRELAPEGVYEPNASRAGIAAADQLDKQQGGNAKPSKAQRWAKLLWDKVAAKRLLNPKRSRLLDWVRTFEKFQRSGPKEGPIPTTKEISYYLKAILPHISASMDQHYWPVVHSAKAFCDKFHQIKHQIDKWEARQKIEEANQESDFFRTKDGRLFVKLSGGSRKFIPPADEDLYDVPQHLRSNSDNSNDEVAW